MPYTHALSKLLFLKVKIIFKDKKSFNVSPIVSNTSIRVMTFVKFVDRFNQLIDIILGSLSKVGLDKY